MNVSRHTRPLIYAEAAGKGGDFQCSPRSSTRRQLGVFEGKSSPWNSLTNGMVWSIWAARLELEAHQRSVYIWVGREKSFGRVDSASAAQSPVIPPPHDDHVQRQAPQPEMWVPDVCRGQRRLLMLSTLCCWVSDASSLIPRLFWGFWVLTWGLIRAVFVFSWFDISLSCVDVDSFCKNIFFWWWGGWKVNLICRCTMELFCPFLLDNGFPTQAAKIHFHPAFYWNYLSLISPENRQENCLLKGRGFILR